MVRSLNWCVVCLLAALPARASVYYVTVAGLGGEPEYEQRFTGLAHDLDKTFSSSSVDAHVYTLTGSGSTRAHLRETLSTVARESKPQDDFVLVLIGHGSFDGVEYKFNLVGPDVSGAELAEMCDSITTGRQLIVNTTSASGASIPFLQRPGRGVIAATRSGSEKNATVFARYWVEALHDPEADLDKDEISEARQAVVEGQAMAVLVDYMLAATGQSLLTSPEVADDLKKQMLTGNADSPEFQNAPVFLRESLTFPYRYGLDFIAQLLRNGGKAKAFAGVLASPPQSTRQIMEPKTYLSGERLPEMVLPDFDQDFRNYERFDVGAVGELDTAVLIDQYAGSETSQKLYPHWRGGYYYAARPKRDATAPLALLYVSQWSDEEHASEFAALYAHSLTQRYKTVGEESGSGKAMGKGHAQESMSGTHSWLTEEGRVVIATDGATVLVTESFDQPTTEKLQHELFAEPTAAK